jgi:hypothetical protein
MIKNELRRPSTIDLLNSRFQVIVKFGNSIVYNAGAGTEMEEDIVETFW